MRNHTRPDQIEDTPVSRRRQAARCCWPGCRNTRVEEVPLCGAHLSIARDAWADRVSPDNPRTYRITTTVNEPKPEPELATEPKPAGIVYYLRSGGFIKIGWTKSLTGRMKAYPPDTVLLATEPGTREDETRRHRQFAVHRTHGREWYAIAADLTRHIDRIKAEHGEPDAVDFAAKPVQIPQPRPHQYVGGNYRGAGLIGEARNPLQR